MNKSEIASLARRFARGGDRGIEQFTLNGLTISRDDQGYKVTSLGVELMRGTVYQCLGYVVDRANEAGAAGQNQEV